ncbi:MAG: DUF2279 domain-containing protein [Flavobacterium lindanitolerans]|uniref:Lipoprotein DUF2279 n=1 Tax=Flavobacterium lindanitolerans TaxID=428988 RepID=A0A497UYF9_9FLAO|nr:MULTISPECIES: DUF2279 domain-containing protein [Flavobacterium]MBL7869635.1 DUF2279 domain-containing protein [Flavobacterium lindanitolerans]PKW29612.1 putative lipoprotein DUF2279 [Flavobacterium lindanitolerans]RLJ34887.1 putative lipoprotein DUF2279 [Flavobacterium lindanitolerans]THD31294.1 MAG: DUF2279 domain-containing protein [Flavobacterium johnsoniae]
MKYHSALYFLFLLLFTDGLAQNQFQDFLRPSDSLNIPRRNAVVISEGVAITGALVGLSQLWYNDYDKSGFHFKNDNASWLQMDKAGHVYSSYHIGRFGAELLNWSGVSKKDQLIYGATTGFVFLTAVEVLDGYSSEWGFSWGDAAANASGTLLYVSQELLWNEQRIVPKFSFHRTPYAKARPEVLGASFSEEILKDYNGQTYWLSANIHSFFKESKIPKWLNVAVGYGGEGMITANDELVNTIFLPEKERTRQFYLSLDVDLTKINTNSHFLKTLFSVFNSVKIPAPTIEFRELGGIKWHFIYF